MISTHLRLDATMSLLNHTRGSTSTHTSNGSLENVAETKNHKESSHNAEKETAETTTCSNKPRFIRSPLTWIVTLVRLLLIVNTVLPIGILPTELSWWMHHSANLRSVLIDPIYTVQHVREAMAIRQTASRPRQRHREHDTADDADNPLKTRPSSSSSKRKRGVARFVDSYRGHETGNSRIHLPPLVLAAIASLLSLFPSNALLGAVGMALVLLLVDFWIAYTLERLSRRILVRQDDDGLLHEVGWMVHMNAKIAPTTALAHIFPLSANGIVYNNESIGNSNGNSSQVQALETVSSSPATLQTQTQTHEALLPWNEIPLYVAHLYYCSPIVILAAAVSSSGSDESGGGGCFQSIPLAFLVTALAEAASAPYTPRRGLRGTDASSATISAVTLAVATYWDVHNIVFLIPMAIWHGATKAKTVGVLWDFYSVALLGLSALLVGSDNVWSIVATTHFYPFTLKGQAPSLSLLWYFGMQMFGRFRPYFEFLLGGFPYLLVAPITIRLHRYPAVLVAIFWFLRVLFRPPGTLYSLNVGLCFLLLNPRSLARMHQVSSLIVLCAIPIPVLLYMVGYWMWLEPSNGEANYVFFQCLAYNIFVAVLFLNFCSASLRRDKALRWTEKHTTTSSISVPSS